MGREFPDREKLYKISARHIDVKVPKLGSNETGGVFFTSIPFIKCNEYKNDTILYDEFSIYQNSSFLDFSNLNKNLSGIYGNVGG